MKASGTSLQLVALLAGGSQGRRHCPGALQWGGRAAPDSAAMLGLAAHRVTHCAPIGRSAQTGAVKVLTERATRAAGQAAMFLVIPASGSTNCIAA